MQYVSVNSFNSNLESVLRPRLFLIYINDLNCKIRYCAIHNFEDDTNPLIYNNSMKKMNKQVNQLTNWFTANKSFLNISKTEVALFKSSRKLTDVPLERKLDSKNFVLVTQ